MGETQLPLIDFELLKERSIYPCPFVFTYALIDLTIPSSFA